MSELLCTYFDCTYSKLFVVETSHLTVFLFVPFRSSSFSTGTLLLQLLPPTNLLIPEPAAVATHSGHLPTNQPTNHIQPYPNQIRSPFGSTRSLRLSLCSPLLSTVLHAPGTLYSAKARLRPISQLFEVVVSQLIPLLFLSPSPSSFSSNQTKKIRRHRVPYQSHPVDTSVLSDQRRSDVHTHRSIPYIPYSSIQVKTVRQSKQSKDSHSLSHSSCHPLRPTRPGC